MPVIPHPEFKPPADPATRIWRYMDLPKFLSLLDRRELFLASLSTLAESDPYEGQYTAEQLRSAKLLAETTYEQYILTTPPDRALSKAHFDNRNRNMSTMFHASQVLLPRLFVNCWHMNEHESDAMWRLYSFQDQGIAIQSTYQRLVDALSDAKDEVYIGAVNYVDYEKESIPYHNALSPALHKRMSFAHERELRAVALVAKGIDKGEQAPSAVLVPANLSVLIERVFVAPRSPAWVVELIRSLMVRFGFSADLVQHSPLYTRSV